MASKKNTVGQWAFLIGVVIAVVLGFVPNANSTWGIILVVLGLVVGLLNITDSETTPFLLSGLTLIIASRFGGDAFGNISFLGSILDNLLVIFVPATIIVAIKNVFALAKR